MFLSRTRSPLTLFVLAACITSPGWSAAPGSGVATPARTARVAEPEPWAREPAVQRNVITRDDGSVAVEELRVRGEVQHITVHPGKGSGLPDYEIVPNTRGRDPNTHGSGSRGAGGQRVWSILKF